MLPWTGARGLQGYRLRKAAWCPALSSAASLLAGGGGAGRLAAGACEKPPLLGPRGLWPAA
eukprot:9576410-Lingulodinium_polyedra.AAC.1